MSGSDVNAVALTVIVATHNNLALLRRCLAGWEEFGPSAGIELIVVADGCTDGTHEYLAEVQASAWGQRTMRWVQEPDVHELRSTNRGIREARGALILSWHDDMFLECRWMVPELMRTFETYPDIGLVSLSRGLLFFPVNEPVATFEDSVDWRRVQSTIGEGPLNWVRLSEVDGVVRPWVVRRSCTERVGMLDETFGLTEWDESDLCYRIRDAGWRIATHGYERGGAYTHHLSSTLGRLPSAARHAIALKSALLFYSRWSARIASDHPRTRRTWTRRIDVRAVTGLLGALAMALKTRLTRGASA